MKRINVFDTTLRDGEQTPGVSLTLNEKLRIANKLDEIGVNVIEAGSAITSNGEKEAIKSIVKEGYDAEIASFTRILKEDIDAALDCDVDSVHLVAPTSDLHIKEKLKKTREYVLNQSMNMIDYCIDHGILVEFSAEDGSRSELEFLRDIFIKAVDVGASRICVCDTVGVLTPERAYQFYSNLSNFGVPLSVHCHNDFGLAVANTIAGIRAGATQFHSTVNGIGERAGNASLEEIVVSLKALYSDYSTDVQIDQLYNTSRLVARLSGVYLQPNKAIVGENAFAHESGIHADGVIKNASTYEPITPEILGRKRKFVIGKHIGAKGLKQRLDDLNIIYNKNQFDEIFNKIKYLGDLGKLVSDVDLQAIADEVLEIEEEKKIALSELSIVSGNKVIPTASVKLEIDNNDILIADVGVGPVDAAIGAVKKGISDLADIELVEYHVDAITGGTDALIDVVVKLKLDEQIISARSTQPDIINASVEAYLSGANRLLEHEEKMIYMDREFNILNDVVIAGFKGNIQDIDETLNIVDSIQNCCDGGVVQLMDANAIAGLKHVKHGIVHGFNSFKNGSNIANDLGIEICLRITGTRQISKALDIIGLKKGEMNICVVLINHPDYFLDELSNIFKRDDNVLKEDEEILKNIYNISEKELAIYSITDILIDRTTELILEI